MTKIKVSRKAFNRLSLAYRLGGFFAILLVMTTFSVIIGRFIEFAILVCAFFLTKGKYREQSHAKAMTQCLFATIVFFCGATALVPSSSVSILFPYVVGIIFTYCSYKYAELKFKETMYDYYKKENLELSAKCRQLTCVKVFSLDNCTEEELANRCIEKRVPKDKIPLMVDLFINKINHSELADKYQYELQTIRNIKREYKKKLTE